MLEQSVVLLERANKAISSEVVNEQSQFSGLKENTELVTRSELSGEQQMHRK